MTQQVFSSTQSNTASTNKSPLLVLSLLGSFMLGGNILFAQAATDTATEAATDHNMEETIVTATRSKKSQHDLIVGTIVITRADIENSGANDLADLLRFHAGLDIGRNGGAGQTTSVFIRGTESNHTLVLVDGVEMNPGTIGGAALQNISPEIIERIEIVKGPRSSLYGSEAIGGVINIITRKADTTSLNAQVSYASYASQQLSGHAAFRKDERFASFTLDWKTTDGFPSLREQAENSGYENLSLNFRGGLQVLDQAIELSILQARGNTEYYGFNTQTFTTTPLDQDYNNRITSLAVTSHMNDNWQSKFLLGLANDRIEQNQFDDFFTPDPKKDLVETDRYSVDWQNTYTVGQQQVIAGGYFEREKTNSLSFGNEYADLAESKALYLGSDADFGKLNSVMAARYTEHDSAGSQVSWNTDLAYQLTPTLRTGITAGSAFRAPDATDRYGFGGNPDLKTEESNSLSVVLNWQSSAGDLNLELFQNNIDNLIETVLIDPDNFIYQNINIAETEIKGVELTHSINFNDWQFDTTAVVQSPKNSTNDSVLLRRARRSLSTHIRKDFEKFDLGLQVLASSKRMDIDAVSFAPVQTAGYVLANLNADYKVNDALSVIANLDNVLDTDYETAAGYQQAARNYRLSLRLSY